jgi:hypothetical protein
MKTGMILTLICSVLLIFDFAGGVIGRYQLNKTVMSYWSLADKASTIVKKSEYIDKFVTALEQEKYQGKYNAIVLTTPDNSYDYNFDVLKSFQNRLHEIQGMDITSFAYQTAIQQITAQEQGEAHAMINVFTGIWWKSNHFLLWNWVCGVQVTLLIIGFIIGGIKWMDF